MNHPTGDVGQSEIAPGMTVGEALMINSQSMEEGRVKIMHVNGILDRPISEGIATPISEAGPHPTPCHPNGEPLRVVIAPVFILRGRRAPEFATPQDKGFLE